IGLVEMFLRLNPSYNIMTLEKKKEVKSIKISQDQEESRERFYYKINWEDRDELLEQVSGDVALEFEGVLKRLDAIFTQIEKSNYFDSKFRNTFGNVFFNVIRYSLNAQEIHHGLDFLEMLIDDGVYNDELVNVGMEYIRIKLFLQQQKQEGVVILDESTLPAHPLLSFPYYLKSFLKVITLISRKEAPYMRLYEHFKNIGLEDDEIRNRYYIKILLAEVIGENRQKAFEQVMKDIIFKRGDARFEFSGGKSPAENNFSMTREEAHKILGTKKGVELSNIRSAYRKRVMKINPDFNAHRQHGPDSPEYRKLSENLRQAKEAYEVLSQGDQAMLGDDLSAVELINILNNDPDEERVLAAIEALREYVAIPNVYQALDIASKRDKSLVQHAARNVIIDYDAQSDAAMVTDIGGIDFNDINVKHQGGGVDIQFHPEAMNPLLNMDIDGFAPIIINITPITNIMPLLGFEPRKEEDEQELALVK
ncbi:DnaJ domain-containing protein, partial [Candidatus Omnitrophota bacterium]